ncbi:hypothetical protein KO561_06955 [Radiobacillus kanasensis]|uniref:alpha/beta fold hydrolase n=1 Tax=Radiobacillus kanasensis TaxID=2844358 RepID=UPI001E60B37C|nr:hypothetical protein [Radiobacillus kanasensis]UFU00667.1 hypothetical protein KO561_06955 [Radiobacillus kanasensis]
MKYETDYQLIVNESTVLSIIKAFYRESFSSTYSYIKVPLLLVHATEPEELQEARKRGIQKLNEEIEDVTIRELPDTNHMLQWDKPKEVGEVIRNWLNQKQRI